MQKYTIPELTNELQKIQEFLEQDYIEANKQPLYEFADLVPEDTNLSSVIWVDGPRSVGHTKRIKFQNNNCLKLNGGELISITISDTPEIPESVQTKLKIKSKELIRIKEWIKLNKQVLLDYSNDKISTKQLYQQIKPLED